MIKNNKTAIVTGVGMDAKTITHILLSLGYNVIITHRRNTSQDLYSLLSIFDSDLKNNPNSSLEAVFMEITDQSSINQCIDYVIKKYGKIDEFYNLAALTHVGDSFKNPIYTLKATGMSVLYILEAIKERTPTTKFFQASTSEMFGGDPKNNPFNENSKMEIRSPYAAAKCNAYDWVKYYRQTYNIFACSAFTFNHSNIYRHPSFYIRKITISAAKIALGKQKDIFLGNINHWRDETYADFCCEAMIKMLQLKEPTDLVIGTGVSHSGEEYLDIAFNYFNLNWKDYVKFDKSLERPNEVVKLEADCRLAQKTINWRPNRMTFKNHISLMCEYDYKLESGLNPIRPDVFKMFP